MIKFQKPRGTSDLYKEEALKVERLRKLLSEKASNYGYQWIITPTIEQKDLFIKSVGEESDIATKELFELKPRVDQQLVLRPEGTAGVIRAVAENKLSDNLTLPLKFMYFSNMFRYERPQSGRKREFWQFGVEQIGNLNLYLEADCIRLMIDCAISLFNPVELVLKINNIGNKNQRKEWIKLLNIYFKQHINELSEESINRIDKNPIRILDDKIDGIKDVVKNAPEISNLLTVEQINDFNALIKILKIDHSISKNIEISINKTLVRGLDYYDGPVFELIHKPTQTVIAGGGKYWGLLKSFGGQDYPGIGFAFGIERLLTNSNQEFNKFPEVDLVICCLSDEASFFIDEITQFLRIQGISVVAEYKNKKIASQRKSFSSLNYLFLVVVGKKEMESDEINLEINPNYKTAALNDLNITEFSKNFQKIVKKIKEIKELTYGK